MVGQRHFAQHRDVAAADQPRKRGGLMQRVPGSRSQAGDPMDPRHFKDLGEGHRREDGGELPRQPRGSTSGACMRRPRGPRASLLYRPPSGIDTSTVAPLTTASARDHGCPAGRGDVCGG
jgi:hypothetical protein